MSSSGITGAASGLEAAAGEVPCRCNGTAVAARSRLTGRALCGTTVRSLRLVAMDIYAASSTGRWGSQQTLPDRAGVVLHDVDFPWWVRRHHPPDMTCPIPSDLTGHPGARLQIRPRSYLRQFIQGVDLAHVGAAQAAIDRVERQAGNEADRQDEKKQSADTLRGRCLQDIWGADEL
jgi:hypothetical protein